MLPILNKVAGSMRSGPTPSSMVRVSAMGGTGDVINRDTGERIGGGKDMSKHVPPACTALIHDLYIVDDIFE
jgi:hypothetical protein